MPAASSPDQISFGDFRLDPVVRELRYRDEVRALRPKSFAVLQYLVENPNRLVPREEVNRAVWPEIVVTSIVLRVCIREIRIALGDEADRFLTTIPRRGYRFTIDSFASNEPERRQLTVMRCDLGSAIDLAQRLDPEDLRSVVQAYQDLAAEVVARHDGHVAQYLVDGLVAYFGYPRANEDDAVRAARAGLALVRAVDEISLDFDREFNVSLAARVGIHTGTVVIGEIRSGEKVEPLALGEAPHIAAHLQDAAEPGCVLVSAATRRLIAGLFVTEEAGPSPLKGSGEILVHRIIGPSGARGRFAAAEGNPTPFVGRIKELVCIARAWEAAVGKENRCIVVRGESGIGKSRLVDQWRRQLPDDEYTWLESGATPYTTGTSFFPVISLVRQGLGFASADTAQTRLAKIEQGLGDLASDENVALVAQLLGASMAKPLRLSPELQRQKTIGLLGAWIRTIGASRPTVVVLEDLQWCDPSSLELVTNVVTGGSAPGLLVLATARPEFSPAWGQTERTTTIELGRLDDGEVRRMVESVADETLPADTLAALAARSDGVPLYAEELVKSLLDRDGPHSVDAIPDTLADSLMARLDRLDGAKSVAQRAAVLGRELDYRLLAASSDLDDADLRRELGRLAAAGIAFVQGDPPDATITFKHALIQETAYQSLLKKTRQKQHARIGDIMESQFPEYASAQPEVVAQHYDQARNPTKAITYYQRAGESAAKRSANEESIRHLQRALELIGTEPDSPARQQRELALLMALAAPFAAARGWTNSEYEEIFVRARTLARAIGDAPELARVIEGLSASVLMRGEIGTALEIAAEVSAAAERSGDRFDQLISHVCIGTPLLFQGNFSLALDHLQKGIALYDPAEEAVFGYLVGFDRGIAAHSYAAVCHLYLGNVDQAVRLSEKSLELARALDHPLTLVNTLFEAGIIRFERRDFDQMKVVIDEAIQLATDFGFPFWLGGAQLFQGAGMVDAGQADAGIAQMQDAVERLALIGNGLGAPPVLFVFADALFKAGRPDEAVGVIELANAQAELQDQHLADAELIRLRAEIRLATEPRATAEAEGELVRALAFAQGQGARLFALKAASSLARLWVSQGKPRAALELLAPVANDMTEGHGLRDVSIARALLAELEQLAEAG